MAQLKVTVDNLIGWYDSAYCAVSFSDGTVRLFNIDKRAFVADLRTVNDPGGVSATMSNGDEYCFAGTYYEWGLGCFEVSSGALIWKRNDLRRCYGLSFSGNTLFAFFNGKTAVRVDPRTGETLEKFRGVKDISASPITGDVLFGNAKAFTLVTPAGEKLWSVRRESFGVLDVGWSPETVAISEVQEIAGPEVGIRCYSRHGELLWRYKARKTHTSPLMFNPEKGGYMGVDFTAGPDNRILVCLNETTGVVQEEREIPHSLHGQFCNRGSMIFIVDYKTAKTSLHPVERVSATPDI